MVACVCVLLLALAAQPLGSNALQMASGDVVTDPDTYSFQAAIQPVVAPGYNLSLSVCSGIIIRGLGPEPGNAANATNTSAANYVDKYFILTAASCVLPGASCNVYLGTNEVRADAVPDLVGITMADMVIHPEFLATGMTHSDMAILTADNITTVFNEKKLVPATLPSIENVDANYFASAVSLTAWGFPENPSVDSTPVLRQVNTHVWPNLICSVIHLHKQITSKHICAGGLINGGPCTGDAGAPLVMQGEAGPRVIGLATLVPVSGCSGKPGVFTRLGSYLAWIMQMTNYDPYQ